MPFRFGKGDKRREDEAEEAAPEEGAEDEPEEDADAEGPAAEGDDEAEVAEEREEPEATPPAPFIRPHFRPSFVEQVTEERAAGRLEEVMEEKAAVQRTAARAPELQRQPLYGSFLVLVRDESGEPASVRQFSKQEDTQAHVELLLEEGASEEGIAVFVGNEVSVQVTRRPVVHLTPREE